MEQNLAKQLEAEEMTLEEFVKLYIEPWAAAQRERWEAQADEWDRRTAEQVNRD